MYNLQYYSSVCSSFDMLELRANLEELNEYLNGAAYVEDLVDYEDDEVDVSNN